MKKNELVEFKTTSERMLTGEEASVQSIERVTEALKTDATSGLTDAEVELRLERFGRNELQGEKSTPFVVKLVRGH